MRYTELHVYFEEMYLHSVIPIPWLYKQYNLITIYKEEDALAMGMTICQL
jgi:hypothetical protein